MRCHSFFFTLLFSVMALAQTDFGSIRGKLLSEIDGEPVPFVSVYVDTPRGPVGTTSDDRGVFHIRPVNAGEYVLHVTSFLYQDVRMTDVLVQPGRATYLPDIVMADASQDLPPVVIRGFPDLIDKDEPSKLVIRAVDIVKRPDARDIAAMTTSLIPGVKRDPNGEGLIIRGSRPQNMATFIDGVRIGGGVIPRVPAMGIKSLMVYAGGIPARYGDVTGGVVIIETKSYMDLYHDANR